VDPILVKDDDGWLCNRCRFECQGLTDALTHAEREHGAEAAWDNEGSVWDTSDPAVLREGGLI
jgi:hypothetical protein